jgi:hypothetical protein
LDQPCPDSVVDRHESLFGILSFGKAKGLSELAGHKACSWLLFISYAFNGLNTAYQRYASENKA